MRLFLNVLLGLSALGTIALRAQTQDIVLSDFEETNYTWLPGGTWTSTGAAFGSSPAQGALPSQEPVDGFLGNGLANTYLNGDSSTGTLLSPPFTIQRNYIKFLIGGGSYRGESGYGGETRVDLLVNGQVVQHAAGPGEWEHLDWEQWNVSDRLGQTATIRMVDSATGGWGHLNMDQIEESDTPLNIGVIVPTNQFINFPVKLGNPYHVVALLVNALAVQEFNIALGSSTNYDFYAFLDLSAYQNTQMVVRVDSTNGMQLSDFVQSSTPMTTIPIYQEALRPIYHFTPRRGFNNDPNGMVYYNGQYHLCYQHNPYDVVVGNQNWGNAVSTDLVHWTELPEALCGDALGQIWSGSSVIDWSNSAGFGSNALVSFYTSAGGHANNNLMSEGQVFTQSLAYSLDQGRTWTKYTNNPVVPNVEGDNRDPKVIWYAPGNKWVMVFWLANHDYGFFSSTNLINWAQTSTFTFPNVIEVPELFQLPLDGDTNNMPWIFYAGAGNYYVGQFNGNSFAAQYGPFSIRAGNSFAAGQLFNNIPASDGRRILIANSTGNFPGMPFNAGMDFPVQLSIHTTGSTPLIYANPVNELALLRTSTNSWPAQPLANGVNATSGAMGEAYELEATFKPGTATNLVFNLSGTPVLYNNQSQQVSCEGVTNILSPSNGVVELHFLVDRGWVEIYGNGGLLYMPMSVTPIAGSQPISVIASGTGAQLLSLNLYHLGSAWPAAPPFIVSQPGPVAATDVGGPATFTVTATGTTIPFSYQWYNHGAAIAGATNSTLNIFPVPATNASYYVVVSNDGGSTTSSVAPLTVNGPYSVAYWRMENQITAPNNQGVPSWPGIADADTKLGQGLFTTGSLPAAIDDLITFNGLSGGPVTLSTNVAPPAMFVNGHSAGNYSYAAEAISNVDGCLVFPQDQYGDELDFTGPFSLELFFKTDGNRSTSGVMQLIAQGTDTGQTFRYGIDINAAAAGAVRFVVANSSLGQTNVVAASGANYADGQWHYLLAVGDTLSGTQGQLRLTIVNQDGSQASATNDLPAGFLPLPAEDNGNLFVGRNSYPVSVTPKTFLGFIDEVQLTAGVVPDVWRIGRVPAIDNHPQITSVVSATNGVSFHWTGAAANDYQVQWTASLSGVWQTIDTLPSADGVASYVDIDPARLKAPVGFYRLMFQ
jgi:fructan beta-fructosidase